MIAGDIKPLRVEDAGYHFAYNVSALVAMQPDQMIRAVAYARLLGTYDPATHTMLQIAGHDVLGWPNAPATIEIVKLESAGASLGEIIAQTTRKGTHRLGR